MDQTREILPDLDLFKADIYSLGLTFLMLVYPQGPPTIDNNDKKNPVWFKVENDNWNIWSRLDVSVAELLGVHIRQSNDRVPEDREELIEGHAAILERVGLVVTASLLDPFDILRAQGHQHVDVVGVGLALLHVIVGEHIKQSDQRHILLELQMEGGFQKHLREVPETE